MATYTATFSLAPVQFTEYDNSSGSQVTLRWLASASGQISISGGVNQPSSYSLTITYSGTANPNGDAPDPSDPYYVSFSTTGLTSLADSTDVTFYAVSDLVFTDDTFTDDAGGVGFSGAVSSDQTTITGNIDLFDPHWGTEIQIPVTLISGPIPLFTAFNDTVDFTALTSLQVLAINAGAQLYNAMGGNNTVVLPSSPDGSSYPLVPQSGAGAIASGIMWDSTQTFVVGSDADTSATIDNITAGVANDPTLGSYQIQINGPATTNITLYDNSNTINNTITLGTGNDTVTLDGKGNSVVVAGSGVDNLNISGGANLVVSSTSTFIGSATIGATSTLELGPAIAPGTITFTGSGARLQIDGDTMPTQTIMGMVAGDTITLSGLPPPIGATVLETNNVLAVFNGEWQ
jgi:hypothetical protein